MGIKPQYIVGIKPQYIAEVKKGNCGLTQDEAIWLMKRASEKEPAENILATFHSKFANREVVTAKRGKPRQVTERRVTGFYQQMTKIFTPEGEESD